MNLAADSTRYLAAAPNPLNVPGITAILGGILTVVVLTLAIRAGLHGHKGNAPAVLIIMGCVGAAAMTWGIATQPGLIGLLGGDLVKAVLKLK